MIALIGDEDSCVGFLLGGIGERSTKEPAFNFMVVNPETSPEQIKNHFEAFIKRGDIDIILIQQNIAELIRADIDAHTAPIPAVLEIPSKSAGYDPHKDSVLKRAKGLIEGRA